MDGSAASPTEIIHVDDRTVACDGGDTAGPSASFCIADRSVLPYCSRLYVLIPGQARDKRAGHQRTLNSWNRPRPRPRPEAAPDLIDGSGFIFRAYHALPPMTRPDGTPVNAVFGFSNMLAKAAARACRHAHRGDLRCRRADVPQPAGDAYKAHRPPPPDDLMPQFDLVRQATAAFGVRRSSWKTGSGRPDRRLCEVCERSGRRYIVVRQDLMQLIRPGVEMLDPIKRSRSAPPK